MKTLLAVLQLLLFAGMLTEASAQAAGNYLYNNPQSVSADRATVAVSTPSGNTVSLKAEVLMNIRATSYTAIFAVAQSGPDAPTVDSVMNARIGLVQFGLAQLGISEEDIHVDAVAMVPTYSYTLEEKKFSKRFTEIPTGFEMKKNIHVLFREHRQLDGIISRMALADIYDMVKVEYNIDGSGTYLAELRKAALDVIHSRETIYTDLGMHLDVYSLGDGMSITYPMERYKSFTAFHSGTSIQALEAFAGKHGQSVSVNGNHNTIRISGGASRDYLHQQFLLQHAEKNKTIFYDRLPYNQFDRILGADMEEPCIQLVYSLQVQYTMIKESQHQLNLKNQQLSEEAAAAGRKKRRR
jgi:uncharacterized protein YggE